MTLKITLCNSYYFTVNMPLSLFISFPHKIQANTKQNTESNAAEATELIVTNSFATKEKRLLIKIT